MRLPLSRRGLIGGAALLAGAAALPGFPLRAAQGARWPHLRGMAADYVGSHRLASMIAYMGLGPTADAYGEGRDTMGGARLSDGDSLYRIYSMTKPITGMAAMILVDEGRLALDQPLAEILPAFAEMKVQKTYDGSIAPADLVPAERPILIRHLLTHTAGLAYALVQKGPIMQRMIELGAVTGRVSRIPIPGFDRGTPATSLALFADRLATLPLVCQPGTRWSYSTGLDLMGRVIEVVSGQGFDAFLQQRIFDPCGMASTWFTVPESETGRLTTNYGVLDGALFPLDPATASVYTLPAPFPMGGSGLVSSPRDYDRFLRMLAGYGTIDGKRVMSAAAVRMGTSDLLPDPVVTKGTSVAGYGFGAGGRVGGADRRNAFGWAGAAGTIGFVDMASGLRSALYTQYMPMDAYPVMAQFEQALLADLAGLAKGTS